MKNIILAFLLLSASLVTHSPNLKAQNKAPFNIQASAKTTSVLTSPKFKTLDKSESKVGPMINYILSQHQVSVSKSLSADEQTDISKIQVLINSTNKTATLSALSISGVTVQSVSGNIIVVEMPLSKISEISRWEHVKSVKASLERQLLLNKSYLETRLNLVHQGLGLDTTYEGEDVVVGIIDSGIDEEHPDFNDSEGSRILYLWDMSGSGNAPSGFTYGREYTKADIDAGNCYQTDGYSGQGHGTHVAGIAAGNGRAKSGYIGAAPKADIIFVKGFRNSAGFSDGDVINGCKYIFQKASAIGKKAVINLSLGGHVGPHDGTTSFEKGLSNLTGQGKIIVASAGNEGEDDIHLSYTTGGSDLATSKQTVFSVSTGVSLCFIDLWYPSGTVNVSLKAYQKSNGNVLATLDPAIKPGEYAEGNFTVGSTTYAKYYIDATNTSDPGNGYNEALIVLSTEGVYDPTDVYWGLITYGTGTLDAWISNGVFLNASGTEVENPDNDKSIAIPGTCKDVFAVGSYVTKNTWVSMDGNTYIQTGATIDELSTFSSHGPSYDGRLKPEITAPGEVIVAALSGDLLLGSEIPKSHVISGGELRKFQGTSMAAPQVTGTIALLLQKHPIANYDTLLTSFKSTSVSDSKTGSTPNYLWGYGKMDAYEAFMAMGESENVQDNSSGILSRNILASNNLSSVLIPYAIPESESSLMLKLDIFDVLGRKVRSFSIQKNKTFISVDLSSFASGMYFYRVNGYSDMKRILIIR